VSRARITGERVVSPAGGFNPTWQRHVAAYALCEPFLGPGTVLDVGCGVGHSYERLAPRETVGVDVDPDALAGQRRATALADMRALPFPDGSFSSVVAVQSIEHVPDPERAVAEAARVLEPDGVAVFITPNRLTLGLPDEVIDPYHFVEFDHEELRRLCEPHFGEVKLLGLFGSARYMELFREERATLDRLLSLDPLRLRRLVPRRVRQRLYDLLLRHFRREDHPRAEAIEPGDFELRDSGLEAALDVCAVCREPRAQARATTCAWCGGPLGDDAARLRGRVNCPRCGAATTDPWPTPEELERAYGGWYRPRTGRRFALFGDLILSRTRGLLAKRLDEIAPPGPVLDVGAGDGVLLDALHRRGREALGLERDSRRPDVRDCSLAEIEGEWAAVVFWHSLEHLPAPGDAISQAARLLRPGGVVAIAVPNNDSLQAAAFGDRWLALDLPRHLVHLSQASLVSRLEQFGFQVERISQLRGGQIAIGWLDGLVRLLPGRLDLYQALRSRGARNVQLTPAQRGTSLVMGIVLAPIAFAAAAVEIALGRSGSVYVEARRA
jgi:SAM-dependent methyltransferase